MRVVAALGGNAIARRGEPITPERQIAQVSRAADALAKVVEDGHDLIITHGNGPQVGMLAAQSSDLPLDVLGAESEGMIGYWIDRELANRLPDREIAALITQVEVDPADPAFDDPTKPIGGMLSASEAKTVVGQKRGLRYAAEGSGYRRVVASPEPKAIVELKTIALLVRMGVLVICGGGGGIPVFRDSLGRLHGCEAVIDKDRFAALLAHQLDADFLLLLTDVPAIFSDWPDPAEHPIRHVKAKELQSRDYDRGSMGPKV